MTIAANNNKSVQVQYNYWYWYMHLYMALSESLLKFLWNQTFQHQQPM